METISARNWNTIVFAPLFYWWRAAAGAARHLLDQIKRALRRMIVGQVQLRVGIDDADQGDVLEVKALRDHLRAQKHGGLRLTEFLKKTLVSALGTGGVSIHADDRHLPAKPLEAINEHAKVGLDALGARAELLQVRASALGARGRRGNAISAMVANQLVAALVIGQRRRTRWARRHEPAVAAQQEFREATLIQQQNRFVACAKLGLERLRERT